MATNGSQEEPLDFDAAVRLAKEARLRGAQVDSVALDESYGVSVHGLPETWSLEVRKPGDINHRRIRSARELNAFMRVSEACRHATVALGEVDGVMVARCLACDMALEFNDSASSWIATEAASIVRALRDAFIEKQMREALEADRKRGKV